MATDAVSIWNQALSLLGNAEEVQSVDENTPSANACRRFYDAAVEEMLAEFPWPFATVTAPLALVATDPTPEWAFSYRVPADCLRVRRLPGALRVETRQSRVPYRIGRDDVGRLLFTDLEDATVEYTQAITDASAFPASFAKALAYRLAIDIAPRVSGGDATKLMERLAPRAAAQLEAAQATALNEEQLDEEPDSEFIRAREAGSPFVPNRFGLT